MYREFNEPSKFSDIYIYIYIYIYYVLVINLIKNLINKRSISIFVDSFLNNPTTLDQWSVGIYRNNRMIQHPKLYYSLYFRSIVA